MNGLICNILTRCNLLVADIFFYNFISICQIEPKEKYEYDEKAATNGYERASTLMITDYGVTILKRYSSSDL